MSKEEFEILEQQNAVSYIHTTQGSGCKSLIFYTRTVQELIVFTVMYHKIPTSFKRNIPAL